MVECAVSVQRAFRKRKCLFIFCLKCNAALFFSLGYLPDGTPMNRAGNAINHPETIGPDPHTPGSPLPRALFCNSVGYLPDGTPMNAAGNALNHPETMQPDMHTPGSPLPPSHYYADVGYLVDGTDMATAGNLSVQGAPPASSMPAAPAPVAAPPPVAAPTPVSATPPVAAPSSVSGDVMHGIKFPYSIQKDACVDLEFLNDVGFLAWCASLSRKSCITITNIYIWV